MAVSRIDILNHEFTRSLRGYNPEEVDNFLHDVADTLGRLADEKVVLSARVVQLESKLSEFEQQEAALRNTLIATQRMTEDLKSGAQREAQLIIDAARAKADNLLQQANQRLGRIFDEISESKKLKSQFEISLRSIIESHLRMLDLQKDSEARLDAGVARLGISQSYTPQAQRNTEQSQQNANLHKNIEDTSVKLSAEEYPASTPVNNNSQTNIINNTAGNSQNQFKAQLKEAINEQAQTTQNSEAITLKHAPNELENVKHLSPDHEEDLLILEKLQGPFELKMK